MGTVSRSGMITTISGLTRNGRTGADAIKVTSTEIAEARMAIAETSRSGSSRLMESSSSEASELLWHEVSHSGSCCLL